MSTKNNRKEKLENFIEILSVLNNISRQTGLTVDISSAKSIIDNKRVWFITLADIIKWNTEDITNDEVKEIKLIYEKFQEEFYNLKQTLNKIIKNLSSELPTIALELKKIRFDEEYIRMRAYDIIYPLIRDLYEKN